jgi:hypothetical protein
VGAYFSESLGLSVLLEAECREVHACAEDFGFGEDADAAYAVKFHLHVWVAVGITEVG